MKKLGFGVMRLPQVELTDEVDMEQTRQMLDAFMEKGFTYFDTAYIYHGGKSEEILRELIVKRYPRDAFTITDKMPFFDRPTAEQLEDIFQEQLERCGVDFFDYYWLHNVNSGNLEHIEEVGGFDFVLRKKAEGKARRVGFSFHDTAEVLDRVLTAHPEMEFVQLQINYLDWEDPVVQSRKCYEVCVKHNKPVIVMEPIKGGRLAVLPEKAEAVLRAVHPEDSMAAWALRFAASLENVMVVLSGMSTPEQVEENLSILGALHPLEQIEQEALVKAADEIRASLAIGCTGCRYCTDGCPQKIAIPDIFRIYNDMKMFPVRARSYYVADYNSIVKNGAKASECIGCCQCEEHCPQHLQITELLQTVAAELE